MWREQLSSSCRVRVQSVIGRNEVIWMNLRAIWLVKLIGIVKKGKCQEYLQSFLLEQLDKYGSHREAGGGAGFREKYCV